MEQIRQQLESETRSGALLTLPNDFYARLADYCQKLRRSVSSGRSEVESRLVAVQVTFIEQMARDLVRTRIEKACSRGELLQLLPEERHVASSRQEFQARLDAFVQAMSEGRPSLIRYAAKRESERSVVVRFTAHVDELIGLDLRRYGPFEVDDVASIPASSAGLLIAGGEAVQIQPRESD